MAAAAAGAAGGTSSSQSLSIHTTPAQTQSENDEEFILPGVRLTRLKSDSLSSPPRGFERSLSFRSLSSPEPGLNTRRESIRSISREDLTALAGPLSPERSVVPAWLLEYVRKINPGPQVKLADLVALVTKQVIEPGLKEVYPQYRMESLCTNPDYLSLYVQQVILKNSGSKEVVEMLQGYSAIFVSYVSPGFLPQCDEPGLDASLKTIHSILSPMIPALPQGMYYLKELMSPKDFETVFELYIAKKDLRLKNCNSLKEIRSLIFDNYPNLKNSLLHAPSNEVEKKDEKKGPCQMVLEDLLPDLFGAPYGRVLTDGLKAFHFIVQIANLTDTQIGESDFIKKYLNTLFLDKYTDEILEKAQKHFKIKSKKQTVLCLASQYMIIKELFTISDDIFGKFSDTDICAAKSYFLELCECLKNCKESKTPLLFWDELRRLLKTKLPVDEKAKEDVSEKQRMSGKYSFTQLTQTANTTRARAFVSIGEKLSAFSMLHGAISISKRKLGITGDKSKEIEARQFWFPYTFGSVRHEILNKYDWDDLVLLASGVIESTYEDVICNPHLPYLGDVNQDIQDAAKSKTSSSTLAQLKKDAHRTAAISVNNGNNHLFSPKSSEGQLADLHSLAEVDAQAAGLEDSQSEHLQENLEKLLRVLATQIGEMGATTQLLYNSVASRLGIPASIVSNFIPLKSRTTDRPFSKIGTNKFSVEYTFDLSPENMWAMSNKIDYMGRTYMGRTYKDAGCKYIIDLNDKGEWIISSFTWQVPSVYENNSFIHEASDPKLAAGSAAAAAGSSGAAAASSSVSRSTAILMDRRRSAIAPGSGAASPRGGHNRNRSAQFFYQGSVDGKRDD